MGEAKNEAGMRACSLFHTMLCEIDKNDSVGNTGGFSAINKKDQALGRVGSNGKSRGKSIPPL